MFRNHQHRQHLLSKTAAIVTIAFGLSGAAANAVPMHRTMADPPGDPPGDRIFGVSYQGDWIKADGGNCKGRKGAAVIFGFADPTESAELGRNCRY